MTDRRRPHVLVLGGTGEAVALAAAAAGGVGGIEGVAGIRVTYSLAGRTRTPSLPAGVRVRTGGFGGAGALADWLRREAADAVIDATHPFAARIAANAAEACRAAGVARLKLLRPAWQRRDGDDWREVADIAAAAEAIRTLGPGLFLSVGQQDLAAFAGVEGKRFLVRTVDPLDTPPLPGAVCIAARGPFDLDAEIALLRAHRIDAIVSRNSGGAATYAKIEAARETGIPVVMVSRPAPPPGPVVPAVADALDWLSRQQEKQEKTT